MFMETIDIYNHNNHEGYNNNSIDINSLIEKLKQKLNRRSDNVYQEELEDVLKILETTFHTKMNVVLKDGISVEWQCYGDELLNNINLLRNIIDQYLNGKICSCYDKINKWWKGSKNNLGARARLLSTSYIAKGKKFFRIRIKDDMEDFTAKDLFHVPFEKRGKIGNERYSVPGFPCLYLGTSLYICWEEMGKPALKDVVASSLQCTEDGIRLFDLRIQQTIKDKTQLENYLVILPFIVACSISVRKKDKDNKFKEEYILPQLLLHSIIQTSNKDYRYDGIIYTSTKSNLFFDDPSLIDNLVIPVKKAAPSGHCSTLSKWFRITPPLYLEREMMKNPTDFTLLYSERDEYEASIFGMAECFIKQTKPIGVNDSSNIL